jgi:hypothetical protein
MLHYFDGMVKTQIQLPDGLYQAIKHLAELKGWSIAETFRRAAEQLLSRHPAPHPRSVKWTPPTSAKVGWRNLSHSEVRERALDDMERRRAVGGEE